MIVTHQQIPDDPTFESERRQPFFFSAAGVPAFYVRRDSRNQFLAEILRRCKKTRTSRRHPGYFRVSIRDYRRALLTYIDETAGDLVEAMNMRTTLSDLASRCADEPQQASHRLLAGIVGDSGTDPMRLEAREFNRMAEAFYRENLRCRHLREAIAHMREDISELERSAVGEVRGALRHGVRIPRPGALSRQRRRANCERSALAARKFFAAQPDDLAELPGSSPHRAGKTMSQSKHQYIDRASGNVVREHLLGNSVISALYSPALEKAPLLTRLASSRYVSRMLGYLNYDNVLSSRATGMLKFLRDSGIQLSEFVGNLSEYDTARKIFERQIRYWNCRPMPADPRAIVCPADSRALLGSMKESSGLYLKQKFFSFPELLGDGSPWQRSFEGGDYAVFRLTPEKYHYTHSPASGRMLDFYSVEGRYFPCNPNAAVQLISPVSKNRRVVTILETDCPNGSAVGRIAMIEVVALMIGQIEQRSSEDRYENPRSMQKGDHAARRCAEGAFSSRQQHGRASVSAESHSVCQRPDRQPASRRRAEPFLADLGLAARGNRRRRALAAGVAG